MKTQRPRIWLDDARLQWLKTNSGRLEWQRLLSRCEEGFKREAAGLPFTNEAGLPTHYDNALNYALVARVTGSQNHVRMAVKLIEIYMSLGTVDAMNRVGTTGPHGFGARIVLPETAVTYDWLWDKLPAATKTRWANQLMAWADWCWLETNPTKGVPPLKNPDNWGQKNPADNFYLGFLMTLVAALAVHGEHPRAQAHVDLGLAKLAVLNEYLAKYARGGVSLEGTNYGSWLRHGFLAAALSTATTDGPTVGPAAFWSDVARSRWHLTAPDKKHMCPLGGQPVGPDAPISEDHTIAPLVALSHGDAGTKPLAKRWLDSVTFTRKKGNSWAPALWYRNEVIASGPFAEPLLYHAPGSGYVSMRDGWGPPATWVVFQCGPMNAPHQSAAAGEFMIYARGQWLTGPARLWGLGGEMLPSEFNNVILVGKDPLGRWRGQPLQVGGGPLDKDSIRIIRPPGMLNGSIWVAGEAGRAYDYTQNGKVWQQLTSWTRELDFTPPNQLTVVDRIVKLFPADEILWQLHCKAEPWIEGREYGILGTGATLRGRASVASGGMELSVGKIYKGSQGALSSHRVEVLIPGGAKEITLTNTLEIISS